MVNIQIKRAEGTLYQAKTLSETLIAVAREVLTPGTRLEHAIVLSDGEILQSNAGYHIPDSRRPLDYSMPDIFKRCNLFIPPESSELNVFMKFTSAIAVDIYSKYELGGTTSFHMLVIADSQNEVTQNQVMQLKRAVAELDPVPISILVHINKEGKVNAAAEEENVRTGEEVDLIFRNVNAIISRAKRADANIADLKR